MSNSFVYDLAVANVRRFDRRAIDVRKSKREESFLQTLKRALIAAHAKGITDEFFLLSCKGFPFVLSVTV